MNKKIYDTRHRKMQVQAGVGYSRSNSYGNLSFGEIEKMAKNEHKGPRTLTGPHTLHPETGQPPAYAKQIFIQSGDDPLAARADGKYLESRGASVKLAPHLHRRGSSIAV